MNPFRRRVIDALVAPLRALAAVEAVWEGGSAATGRLDAFSDVDLCIVAPIEETAAVLDVVERALATVAPIEHAWRVEPPAFRDMAQRFYLLAGAPPFFAVDCSVLTPAGVAQFLERERHGEPLVYFDRGGRVRAVPLDRSAHEAKRSARPAQIGQAAPVYALLARKELARARSRLSVSTRRCCARWSSCSAWRTVLSASTTAAKRRVAAQAHVTQ
jgi:predicted nucleotidyltransferase